MDQNQAVTTIDLASTGLKKITSGKVREIFEVDENTLLFVATDRISAYDFILDNGIPGKGILLTQLSAHWFKLIQQHLPNLRTHLISTTLPPTISQATHAQLTNRSMLVRRLQIIPLESIVRGYITGSAWAEYKNHGTVHGMAMPPGLRESEKFPTPIWTPSTKAEQGEHDENISKERAEAIVGKDVAERIERASLEIYQMAHDYATARNIIIADTKFEFGLDPRTGDLVLVDEVLTPDSSRFWSADEYVVGQGQASYDKQSVRDWLTRSGLKGKPGVRMPEEVVADTVKRYGLAYEKLTGEKL